MLGRSSAEQDRETIHQLVFLKEIAIFGRLLHVAERGQTARNDRHLVHRLCACGKLGDDGVAGLMERDDAALFGVGESILPLEPDDDAIDRRVQLGHADFAFFAARRKQSGFVEDIFEIGADHARRAPRDVFEVDVAGQLHLARVHLQNRMAAGAVRAIDQHLAIEASGAKQRVVENLRPVGGADAR